jgi:hypothetical protein
MAAMRGRCVPGERAMPSRYGFETEGERRRRSAEQARRARAWSDDPSSAPALALMTANTRARELHPVVRDVLGDYGEAKLPGRWRLDHARARPSGISAGTSDPTWTLNATLVEVVLRDGHADEPYLDVLADACTEDIDALADVLHRATALPVLVHREVPEESPRFGMIGSISKRYETVGRVPERRAVPRPRRATRSHR